LLKSPTAACHAEGEAREKDKAKESAAEAERAATRISLTSRTFRERPARLTVTPGALAFEPRKQNEKKSMTIQCSEIKRSKPASQLCAAPRKYLLTPVNGKERQLMFYTGTPASGGLFGPPKPATNITAEVINAIIEACRMARINK